MFKQWYRKKMASFFLQPLGSRDCIGRVVQPFVPQLVQEHGANCYWLPFTAIVEHAEFVECAEYVEYAFSLLSYALTCFVCFPSDHQVQYSSWKTNHVPAVSGRIAPETHRQHLGLVWRCLDSLDNVLHVLHCSCYAWSQAFQLSCSTAAHSCNHDLFFFQRGHKAANWFGRCLVTNLHVLSLACQQRHLFRPSFSTRLNIAAAVLLSLHHVTS